MAQSRLRPAIDRLRVKHLRLLELLVEVGTVRKAAERLHVSQPAVSQMLKELEDAFGGTLFSRTHGGVAANERVDVLLRRLRPVLGELGAAQDEMLAGAHTTLRIGANLQSITHLLPGALQMLRSRDAGLRFVVREGTTSVLIDALLAGELDCTIGPPAATRPALVGQLRFWPLHGGELCLVVGRSHPLARRRRLTLADLANEAWALGGSAGQARAVVEQLFLREGLQLPQPVLECRPQFANMAFAAKMQLVTVATRADAVAAQAAGTIHILPIDLPVESAPIAFICRKSSADDAALTRLRDALGIATARIR